MAHDETSWDAVEMAPIGTIKRYPDNPRDNAASIDAVARSIAEFGWQQPIVVDEQRTIIAGDTRYLAAEQLGRELVPVKVATGLTPDQVRAYRIADNRSSDKSAWLPELLRLEIGRLDKAGYDASLTLLSTRELATHRRPNTSPEPGDDTLSKKPKKRCKPGDLWILGKHRLACGDSTDPATVALVLDGERPALCVTDPPYGVEYDPTWREGHKRDGKVLNDDRIEWQAAFDLCPSSVLYCWCAPGAYQYRALVSLEAAGFIVRNQLIWLKTHFPFSRGAYTWKHETCFYLIKPEPEEIERQPECGYEPEHAVCWYGVRKAETARWVGPNNASTIWEAKLDAASPGNHGTQKPVELFTNAIANHLGDVYEPFAGSGTCIIAAERLGRRCFAVELSPEYCDGILARWQEYTGEAPTRA